MLKTVFLTCLFAALLAQGAQHVFDDVVVAGLTMADSYALVGSKIDLYQ